MSGCLQTWVDIGQIASGVGGIASAIGLGVAVWQLDLLKQQSTTTFEDRLVDDYRAITEDLPLEALLGDEISTRKLRLSLPAFYRYFDLCNQQVFLYRQGRIRAETWSLWREGIVSNLQRPAFAHAWAEIAARAKGDFNELRELLRQHENNPQEAA